jgi:DNA-damage-inducible protein J
LQAQTAENSSANCFARKTVRYNASHIVVMEVAMASTTMVHVRVDEQIKAQATETLAAMGLSVSDAVRVFLMRVVADQQMPFTLKVPNTETRAAMIEADDIVLTRKARFETAAELIDDLEKNSGQ